MEMLSAKLFFSVILTFIVASVCSDTYLNCSLTSGPSPITNIKPIKYNVYLTINPEVGTISTVADIIIQAKVPTKSISLHGHGMKLDIPASKIKPTYSVFNCKREYEYEPNKLRSYNYCKENDILILEFENKITAGYFCMHLVLISLLSDNKNFVNFPYRSSENHDKWLFTNLYTSNAIRGLFPCWDDPTIEAIFNISVKKPVNYTALSSAPVWYETIDRNDTRLTYFREIRSTITYLGIAVVNVTKMYEQFQNISIMWHQSNKAKRFENAQNIARLAILYLAERTNTRVSDIIKRIDHIIVPNAPMKSAGKGQLIIYREKDVTYNDESDIFGKKIDVSILVSYEMARQWFVDYISPNLKNDIWINEILASSYSYYMTAEFLGPNKFMPLFIVQNLPTALDSDVSLMLEPIIHKAKHDSGIDGLLYSQLYHKKAFALTRMLNYILTPEVFEEVIEKYIHIRNESLWTVLDKYYEIKNKYTIKEVIDPWLMTAHYPTLKIDRKDRRIIVHTSETTREQNNEWKISINIMRSNLTSYNITNIMWLQQSEMEIIADIGPDFYILNVEQVGFYRVNYDYRNWQIIAAYLQFDNYTNIPVLNRAQLINDVYYCTIKDALDPYIFVELTRYLARETDYIPWYSIFNILADMSNYLEYSKRNLTRPHFLYILNGLLQNVGYEERPGDDDMTKSLRLLGIKWACKLGHVNCRIITADRLTMYIRNQPRMILSVWKSWLLCTGMIKVTSNIWDMILHEAIDYNSPELLESLICSEDEVIINYYLSLMLHTNIGTQLKLRMGNIYLSVVKKHVRKDAVLKYVLDNYEKAVNRFVDFENGVLVGHIVMSSSNSMESLEQIHAFVRNHSDDHQMLHMFQKTSAARSRQIMREKSKFEMF